MNPRDERGWRVPRKGTKSEQIYDLMMADFKTKEIADLFQENRNTIGILIWRIKHPKDANAAAYKWMENNYEKAMSFPSRIHPKVYSKYVIKLARTLNISRTEAIVLERKELEKLK